MQFICSMLAARPPLCELGDDAAKILVLSCITAAAHAGSTVQLQIVAVYGHASTEVRRVSVNVSFRTASAVAICTLHM